MIQCTGLSQSGVHGSKPVSVCPVWIKLVVRIACIQAPLPHQGTEVCRPGYQIGTSVQVVSFRQVVSRQSSRVKSPIPGDKTQGVSFRQVVQSSRVNAGRIIPTSRAVE